MANYIDQQIGARLRSLREREKVNLEDAAFACQLSIDDYRECEAGRRKFMAAELLDLCDLLDSRLADILGDLRLP